MLYAKVVVGLPIDGPFDYIVPSRFYKRIKVGVRVEVGFRNKKIVGYVVGLTQKTTIKNTKPILKIFDEAGILDKNMLLLTKELADYYCCSWGEAIETALPEALRRGKRITVGKSPITAKKNDNKEERALIHALERRARWDIYLKAMKETLNDNRSVIVLLPDFNSLLRAKQIINVNLGISAEILSRRQPKELEAWLKIKEGKANIVVATRSGIFAPFNNLGLVIIDEEHDPAYKQDQSPHYHTREVAFMRVGIEKAKLILGSFAPSLESIYLTKREKLNTSTPLSIDGERSRTIKYTFIPKGEDSPQVKIIDIRHSQAHNRRREILSKFLADSIYSVLNSKGKTLLFLNRKGFATVASCSNCGLSLKCPRCNINLNYHFKDSILNCHYCNFKLKPPKICPDCNSGYIRYAGTGTEKLESELSRIFATARIKSSDNQQGLDIKDIDILVATSSIIKQGDYPESVNSSNDSSGSRSYTSRNSNIRVRFDLTGVILIDNSLNRPDLRSSEKTYALLMGLLELTKKELVIQTRLPTHHCFSSLIKKDSSIFYEQELRQREELDFPPYKNLILVKLRGKIEDRVREVSQSLFERLRKCNKNRNIKFVAVNPGYPLKLRGNFYWQILIRTAEVIKTNAFLKINLKNFSHSGIIVTVDDDPI